MRKTWVKRDNIYYKPFYKQKLKMTLLGVLLMAFVFFGYQFFYISQLQTTESSLHTNPQTNRHGSVVAASRRAVRVRREGWQLREADSAVSSWLLVKLRDFGRFTRFFRGIRLRDLDAYQPGSSAAFRCLSSTRHVSWARINDDYCDCPEDGSDEPGTGACDRGRFYCRFQKRHATGRGGYTSVPSGWANDGVCDCCDGSDEWLSGADCRNTCKERFPY
ncbi:conserved hypothetical protein [Culex quinquefasciatus]|uniref:Glucosidase II beta subunit N-terminal domain-containing protein n=1 Tax=Culex quinquefasciatus TaxID=7176 RepID=B0WUZ7_CULQU|nr:conserved hypothetical protein [Culex quinquefasciatus]|eukprot:XP_001860318.1 conserved hypothetical protein [Culex quinquefasciatus]